MSTALLMVDVQNDFLPGGALPVPYGNEVVGVLHLLAESGNFLNVVTKDWHPPNHSSFREYGGIWPTHCVKGTEGARLHTLIEPYVNVTIKKGENYQVEQYSGFQSTHLSIMLHSQGYTDLLVGGLATEYCVQATVLDALKEGFGVSVIQAACRGIDVGDSEKALEAMAEAGAVVV